MTFVPDPPLCVGCLPAFVSCWLWSIVGSGDLARHTGLPIPAFVSCWLWSCGYRHTGLPMPAFVSCWLWSCGYRHTGLPTPAFVSCWLWSCGYRHTGLPMPAWATCRRRDQQTLTARRLAFFFCALRTARSRSMLLWFGPETGTGRGVLSHRGLKTTARVFVFVWSGLKVCCIGVWL